MTEVTPPAPDGHRALKSPAISFEFFPPKTEEMEKSLWETIKRLAPLSPNFVSVTYGAGGSTRERTHSTIARILNETDLLPAAHLTCVGAARGEIDDIVGRYHEIGVRHIVALRGDPPGGIGTAYSTHPDGYQTSAELVAGIKKQHGDIEISVSAYPEKHPESRDYRCRHRHAHRPRSMPARRAPSPRCSSITTCTCATSTGSARAASRFRSCPASCRCTISSRPAISSPAPAPSVPDWLAEKFDGLDDDAETRKLVAATVAAGQVQKLAKHGVDTFHFYTMNRADLVFAISHLLGIRPQGRTESRLIR